MSQDRVFVADTGSPLPQFGFASSVLVHGEHIYVQAGAGFAKLEKLTGKIVWQMLKDEDGMNGSAFSSPVFATIAGVPQFVVQTRTNLAGVSPEEIVRSKARPSRFTTGCSCSNRSQNSTLCQGLS